MSMDDLKGKSFAFTDPQSTSGFIFPLTALKKAGVELDDFSRVEYVKRHANSLLAVYSRQIDSGAMYSTATSKVKVDFDQIRVLWESAPIYRGPWVARSDLPEETIRKIRTALLEIGRDEQREKIFETLSTKGFVPGQDGDYENVREAESLKNELRIDEKGRGASLFSETEKRNGLERLCESA